MANIFTNDTESRFVTIERDEKTIVIDTALSPYINDETIAHAIKIVAGEAMPVSGDTLANLLAFYWGKPVKAVQFDKEYVKGFAFHFKVNPNMSGNAMNKCLRTVGLPAVADADSMQVWTRSVHYRKSARSSEIRKVTDSDSVIMSDVIGFVLDAIPMKKAKALKAECAKAYENRFCK